MSNATQPLRIGLIGAGGNTRLQHIPGFRRCADVHIDLVANRSEASARKVATDYCIPRVAADWQAVIADPLIDAVCIGTWPYLHCEITLAALSAGKHVLTEARMAMNAQEAEQMLAAAQANPHLVAQVVPAPFSLEFDATIIRLIHELGPLHEVSVSHTHSAAADPKTPISWRQRADLSGNNVLTMGIFCETLQRWFGPAVEPAHLQAVGSIVTAERPQGDPADSNPPQPGSLLPVTIPDTLGIIGSYNNGVRFQHHYSSVTRGAPRMEIILNLELGTLRYDLTSQKLILVKAGTVEALPIQPDAGTAIGWHVEEDFVNSIRTGAPVRLTSFADGLRYMRFTDSVHASLKANGCNTCGQAG